MNFKEIAVFFKFTGQQRTGIFLLFVIIIVLQLVIFIRQKKPSPEKEEWISLQTEI